NGNTNVPAGDDPSTRSDNGPHFPKRSTSQSTSSAVPATFGDTTSTIDKPKPIASPAIATVARERSYGISTANTTPASSSNSATGSPSPMRHACHDSTGITP